MVLLTVRARMRRSWWMISKEGRTETRVMAIVACKWIYIVSLLEDLPDTQPVKDYYFMLW